MQEFVSDVVTQQTRLVDEAMHGVWNGWNDAVQQLVSPRSPSADTISSDQVNSLVKQFQPTPDVQRPVDAHCAVLAALRFVLAFQQTAQD